MKRKKFVVKALPFLIIIILGGIYLRYTSVRIEKEASHNILQIARSIEAAMPKDSLKTLRVDIGDLKNPYYITLKNTLKEAIRVNDKAKFAYLYTQKNGNIYFMADSEPENSSDYSPPGQEFSEAAISDWQPLIKGVELVTKPLTDRWGTWISALIPIKDKSSGKCIAVFGMDFSAESYQHEIFIEEFRTSAIIALLLLVLFFLVKIRENNLILKNEIVVREEAERMVKQQNEELQELNITKDKFFSIIAHDLRGPFAGFLGLTEMLAQTLHTMSLEQIQKFASSMEKSSKNLYRLLENLLQWSLMQRNVLNFKPQPNILLDLINESLAPVIEMATAKQIEIKIDIPVNLSIYADNQMFNTITRNLVTNAIKFTPQGGKVTLSADSLNDKFVEIAIKDTGIGMPEDILKNLFNLGAVTSRKGTEGEPSTGLGLIICKDFVDKHGGKIRVESKEGKGSTFYFTFPVVEGGIKIDPNNHPG
jgi:signal transduction histidine kinase